MNELTTLAARSEPGDCRGPFEPVRPAVRQSTRATECHRCGEAAIPDLIHLVDRDGDPLCPTCIRHTGVAIRRGLQALNQLAHAARQPGVHPAQSLVWEWQTALAAARTEEQQLLRAAAALIASHNRGTAS
ncbi:hypothetical protein ABZ791_30375 [Streptomyces huasconensis]|uniref:Uncharacterized protein n=1 Tax=Streptomyces huasconensis TaxID=1854574 RepID=A0ABV3M294_9ACTN